MVDIPVFPAAGLEVFTIAAVFVPVPLAPPDPAAAPAGGITPAATLLGLGTAAALFPETVTVTSCVIICGKGVTVTVGAGPLANMVIVTKDNWSPL